MRKALAESEAEEGALFSVAEGRGEDQEMPSSAATARNGRKTPGLDAARDYELQRVGARYRDIRRHSFPVAVIFVVPRREAVR